jgi:hypothetical protein
MKENLCSARAWRFTIAVFVYALGQPPAWWGAEWNSTFSSTSPDSPGGHVKNIGLRCLLSLGLISVLPGIGRIPTIDPADYCSIHRLAVMLAASYGAR